VQAAPACTADPLSLDPVSSSYRETAAFASRSEAGPITASAIFSAFKRFCSRRLHVFFVIRHANREILHVGVTRYPTAEWAAQQIVECCAWDRWPTRFLIHDRDSRYGMTFNNRLRRLGIKQIRTPYRSPRANAVAER
jgi:hypothetical protein